jgi:hypothetical protein
MASFLSERELDDLVLLDAATDEGVAAALGARLRRALMYTWLGPVLVSVNPYQLLRAGPGGRSVYDEAVRPAPAPAPAPAPPFPTHRPPRAHLRPTPLSPRSSGARLLCRPHAQ